MRYAIVIEKGPTSYGAYVPDLPGCVAVGKSAATYSHSVAGSGMGKPSSRRPSKCIGTASAINFLASVVSESNFSRVNWHNEDCRRRNRRVGSTRIQVLMRNRVFGALFSSGRPNREYCHSECLLRN